MKVKSKRVKERAKERAQVSKERKGECVDEKLHNKQTET